MSEIPTIGETIRGYEVLNWFGLMAPAKTPVPVIERVNREVARSMAKTNHRERLAAEGVESAKESNVTNGTSAGFAAMLTNEIDKWGRVGREIGLRLD